MKLKLALLTLTTALPVGVVFADYAPSHKIQADKFWPRLVEAKAGLKNPVDGLLAKSVLAEAR